MSLNQHLSTQPKNESLNENTRGGVETSQEKMTREFAILQKAFEVLQAEVREIKKPVPQKVKEAAQRNYQKRVEQLQKLYAKMVALNDKIEAKKRKAEEEIESGFARGKESLVKGVQSGFQKTVEFAKNDAKQTWSDVKSAGQKLVEIDRIAGEKVNQAAEFVVQGSYDNLVAKPSRRIENFISKKTDETKVRIDKMISNLDKEILKRPIKKENLKIINLMLQRSGEKKLEENIKTIDDYINSNLDNFLSPIEQEIIIYLVENVTKSNDISQKKSANETKKFLNQVKQVATADIGEMAKDKLKNLFGKKKRDLITNDNDFIVKDIASEGVNMALSRMDIAKMINESSAEYDRRKKIEKEQSN